MLRKYSRTIAAVVVCFFTWTSGGVFSIAHAAQEAVKKVKAQEQQQKKTEGTEERFSKVTEELRETLADPKGDLESKRQRLTAGKGEIEALDADIRKQFAATEKRLKDAKLPAEILARHHKFVKHYDDNLAELKGNIERVEKAKDNVEAEGEVEKTRRHLEKVKAPARHQPLDPNNLPHRQPKVQKREPRMKKEEFERDLKKDKNAWRNEKRIMVASAGSLAGLLVSSSINAVNPPTADDLAETIEVQLTPEIRAKAQELGNSPVKIYEWVRNNVEFIPTWGSIQGAQMTLLTKQGNAFDTASLLIALLRAAGIHARYVTGTIELPIDKIMNWAGGFSDPQASLTFIASGGVPVKAGLSSGKITKAQLEHVWVEAYLPYGNYRGATKDQSISTWIPLDASFKQYSIVAGFDVTTLVSFSRDSYLSNVNNQNSLHYYQSKIQAYLDATMPDKSIVDAKGRKEIAEEKFKFLPSSLPYKTIVIANKTSEITTVSRSKVTFRMKSADGMSDAIYSVTTPELAGKRVTLSYRPATSGDEALVASYGGFMFNVPAYMLQVKPELRVEGTVVLTGEATTIGNEQSLTMEFSKPGGSGEVAEKMLVAGGYYAFGLDLGGINEGSLGKRNGALRNNIATLPPEAFSNDDLIGEHLNLLAMTYFYSNDKLYSSGAKLYNVAQMRTLSGSFVSIIPSVIYYFSIPRWVTPAGLEMDVKMDRVIAVAKDGNLQAEKSYMEMIGLISSFNEHNIFESIDGFSSVSTVKALQTAKQSGIAIYRINATNVEQVVPLLQVRPEVVADIRNSVNAGREITIPQRNVQINNWNGVGYIVEDPDPGSGAYMISGGLAGGGTTSKADGNKVVQIYSGPYVGIKDRLDPNTQRTIVLTASIQEGETIKEEAESLLKNQDPDTAQAYADVGQCSGLVRLAYKAAGIYLDSWSGNGKDNLVTKYRISGSNGVSYHYNLANTLKINNSVRTTNDPLIGDIVYFNDTSGPGHPLNHEGIVVTLPDSDGTVEFIDATRSSGVRRGKINIQHPSDKQYNTTLARSIYVKKYAGELFAGFGTIRNK